MKENIPVIIAALVIIAAIVVVIVLMGRSSPAQKQSASLQNSAAASSSADSGSAKTTSDGLQITDVQIGTGTVAQVGDKVTVSYVGSFPDGKVFDASANHGGSFSFVLGAGQVIKGWDEGVLGMRVGGERKLVVPPSLGYGSTGTPGGPIPPNATLDFTISLLKVQAP